MENIVVKMDIRGFIRFSEDVAKAIKLDKIAEKAPNKEAYADIEVDPVGKPYRQIQYKRQLCCHFQFLELIL